MSSTRPCVFDAHSRVSSTFPSVSNTCPCMSNTHADGHANTPGRDRVRHSGQFFLLQKSAAHHRFYAWRLKKEMAPVTDLSGRGKLNQLLASIPPKNWEIDFCDCLSSDLWWPPRQKPRVGRLKAKAELLLSLGNSGYRAVSVVRT